MTDRRKTDPEPADKDVVVKILRAHLPSGSKVWLFGSRVQGRAKPYSELDLAIDAGRRLSLDETAILSEAFSESDLAYKVDLVARRALEVPFSGVVEADSVILMSGDRAN